MYISTITKHVLFGRQIHLIRDDLLNINSITGNKVRKLAYFMNPTTTNNIIPNEINTVASFGGSQSNAMVAISQLVRNLNTLRQQKLQFIYFTKYVSPQLLLHPIGNLKNAMDRGMQVSNLFEFDIFELI